MNAKGLKVGVIVVGEAVVFAGLAWGLRDERVPHAGVPEIVTRSSLNPQDYGLLVCGSAVAIATSLCTNGSCVCVAWQCAKGTSHAAGVPKPMP
jgi:hypothetical protein